MMVLAMACLQVLCGCDRTAEKVHREANFVGAQSVNATAVLERCVAAYAQLESYEDQGSVILKYKLNGRTHTDVAPLQVAWEQGGRLGLRVYSVTAGPHGDRWRLRLGTEEASVTGQVLSRTVPKKLDFEWLLSDPLIARNLGAGLAGFPPQLDLLLSPKPLLGLLQQQPQLELTRNVKVEDQNCDVVDVTQGKMTYRLFIDSQSGLLRRLQLPNDNLPEEMRRDQRVTDVSLSIEFRNIRLNKSIDWQRYRVDLQAGEKLVNHFVAAPPPLETTLLGRQVPGFLLHDAEGLEVFNTAGARSSDKILVLAWLADHPACRLAAAQLAASEAAVLKDQELRERVQYVSLWAESQPPSGLSFETLPQAWGLPGNLALDREALGRDLFAVQEAPTVVILDEANRIQFRESRANPMLGTVLPSLLRRVAAGENLAASLRREQKELEARFAASLRIALSLDELSAGNPPGSDTVAVLGGTDTANPNQEARRQRSGSQNRGVANPLKKYNPLAFSLREIDRMEHSSSMLAATVDAQQRTWLLNSQGSIALLSQTESQPDASELVETPWSLPPDVEHRLCVSPKTNFVALYRVPTKFASEAQTGSDRLWKPDPQSPRTPQHGTQQHGTQSPGTQGPGTGEIEILEVASGKNQTMYLGDGASPTDLRWLTLSGAASPRLAVLTSDQRTLLLDPLNREQLSGTCPSPPLAILPGSPQDSDVDGWVALADRTVQPLRLSPESTHNNLKALGRRASHHLSGGSEPGDQIRRLDFWPAAGPWLACETARPNGTRALPEELAPTSHDTVGVDDRPQMEELTLARGWLARNEPAAFLLDEQLRIRWHNRLAVQPRFASPPRISAAVDPRSGLATWIVADADQIMYLMRADGLIDHFRISDHLIHISLLARGDQLILRTVEPPATVDYEIRWR